MGAEPAAGSAAGADARVEGDANIAVRGDARGTFVAGTGNRVTVVGGLVLAILLTILALVGFGFYDLWREGRQGHRQLVG